jgi:hypothetical protein
VKTLIIAASLVVLGGSIGIILAARDSGGVVSLGAPPTVAGSEIANTLPSQPSFEVWFARGERLVPVARTHEPTAGVATAAINAMLAGPTRAERKSRLRTAVPTDTRLLGISLTNGIATVDLTSEYQSGGGSLSMQMRLAQVVYTVTQFPTVKAVLFQLDGAPVNVFSGEGIILDHPVGRTDYKDLAPTSPTVTGTWGLLPAAPIAVPDLTLSVWTGKEMILFGRVQRRGSTGEILGSANVAAAYDPGANAWRRLSAVRLQRRPRAPDELYRRRPREAVADERAQPVCDVVGRIAPVHVVEVDHRERQSVPPYDIPRAEIAMADHVVAEGVVIAT